MSIILTQSATRVRGTGEPSYSDLQEASMALSKSGNLYVQDGAPKYQEMSRLGQLWAKTTDNVATIAAALPTTTAAHTFWNGNGVGGKSAVIISLSWTCLTTGAAADAFNFWLMVDRTADATQAATADTATAVSSLSGQGAYAGGIVSSHTVTVANHGWFTLGRHSDAFLTATKSTTMSIPIDGMIIIRPTHALCVSIGGVGTTAAGECSLIWREVQLDMQG